MKRVPSLIERTEVRATVVILAGVAVLFGFSLTIGIVLTRLAFVSAAFVALGLLVIVGALTAAAAARVWARLPR
jgi:hypothetical protein